MIAADHPPTLISVGYQDRNIDELVNLLVAASVDEVLAWHHIQQPNNGITKAPSKSRNKPYMASPSLPVAKPKHSS